MKEFNMQSWHVLYNQALEEIRQLEGEELVDRIYKRVSQDVSLSEEGFDPPLHPKRLESPSEFLRDAYRNGDPQFRAEFEQACSTILGRIGEKEIFSEKDQLTLTNIANLIAWLPLKSTFPAVSQLIDQGILSGNKTRFTLDTEQRLFAALMNSSPPDQPLDARFRRLLQEDDFDFWAAGFEGIAVKERSEAMKLVPELFKRTEEPFGMNLHRGSLIWFLAQSYAERSADNNDFTYDTPAFARDLSILPPNIITGFLLSLRKSGEDAEKLNAIKKELGMLDQSD